MKTRIYSPDIECDSCIKVLGRALDKTKGVKGFTITTEYLDIMHEGITKKKLLELVKAKGYRASLQPYDRPRIRERTQEFFTNKKKYAIEWRLLKRTGLALILALVLELIIILAMNNVQPGFAATYAPWLFYLTISTVFLSAAIWHFFTYKTTVTCMTGMMIGMTIGMQTGMLVGAVIGVTNGFFWGATVGMILGSIVGVWTGKCCGIMGVMEGLMAGIMGGTMGAMITVMMFYDNIHFFMPLYVLLNLSILVGFSYMLFEELVEGKDVHAQPPKLRKFLLFTITALVVLTAIIILLPKSIFLQ